MSSLRGPRIVHGDEGLALDLEVVDQGGQVIHHLFALDLQSRWRMPFLQVADITTHELRGKTRHTGFENPLGGVQTAEVLVIASPFPLCLVLNVHPQT